MNTRRFLASILISSLIGVLVIPVHTSRAIGQEEQKKDVWKGKLWDGTTITERDLYKILEEHKKCIDTDKKEGKWAYLSNANLSEAFLPAANLTGANLFEADLSGAYLS